MNRLLPLLVLPLLAGRADADVLSVPGDHPTLDRAVKAAQPNDTILLGPGTWGPVTIDRPLRLVGLGNPTIVGGGSQRSFRPPIRLEGYGLGRVRVCGLTIGGSIDGTRFSAGAAGVEGHGFDSLELYDCLVEGPVWSFTTGIGFGQSAVDVELPYLVLERTIARASGAIVNGPLARGIPGAVGVRAAGTVLLADSIVQGGTTGPFTHVSLGCAGECLHSPGGDGVHCPRLFTTASQVSPGFGAAWFDVTGQPCCQERDGVAVRAGEHAELGDELNGTGAATVGGAFSLSWTFSEPVAGLYFSPNLVPAVTVAGSLSFLDPTNVQPLGAVTSGGNLGFLVPPTATGVLGLPFAFQLLFPSGAVSRPVAGMIYD